MNHYSDSDLYKNCISVIQKEVFKNHKEIPKITTFRWEYLAIDQKLPELTTRRIDSSRPQKTTQVCDNSPGTSELKF